ncbi:hypothetical protein ACIQVE_21280 [Pseudomonas sp. NPDC098747]|uniref:hypothetical protein n=1 Tax=Pseudomonas sp. NPDC098747 TaxID=3364487 RepID=UPI00383B05A2
MCRNRDRSIEMVEQQIEWIGKSSFPDSNLCEGMIQANLAHGFINQGESLELTERAYGAASARRAELHRQDTARRLADIHALCRKAP